MLATKLSELFTSWPITKDNHNTTYVFKFLLGNQLGMEASIYTTHLNVPSTIVSEYYYRLKKMSVFRQVNTTFTARHIVSAASCTS